MTADHANGRLAQIRIRRGWTLQALSDQVGLDVAYLSRLESGTRANPTLITLVRLARACGTSISCLAGIPEEELDLLRPAEKTYPGMKDRIRWIRLEQGLAQSTVARECGLTASYLSQLESGAKDNPTLQQLLRLATALRASLPFLVGELPDLSPEACLGPRFAARTFLRFVRYRNDLPVAERAAIRDGPVEARFRAAALFLLTAFPFVYTPAVLAFQLAISLAELDALMAQRWGPTRVLLDAMARLTGTSARFFATGDLTERSACDGQTK